jgi:tetratricopeptide (TPR) repeat protein
MSAPTGAQGTVARGVPRVPEVEDPRIRAIRQLLRASRYDEAQMVAEAVLAATPNSAQARFYAGLALHKQKMYARARPLLEYAAEHAGEFPQGPHAIHYVGWCAFYLGDLPAARRAFTEHLNAFPSYDDTHFGLGLVALEEGSLAEAETCFRAALDLIAQQGGLPRERAKNLARLGDVLLAEERTGEAEMAYRQAVALWRDHHEAWAKLARILDRKGSTAEADVARAEQRAALERMTAEGIPWRP